MRLLERILAPWHALQRHLDVEILWPICCREAGRVYTQDGYVTPIGIVLTQPVDAARAVFAMHAMEDPAWRVLGADEICRRIDALQWTL